MEQDLKILEKFTKIVKGKDYNAKNGWHGYYDEELMDLGTAIERLIKAYKELEEERQIVGMPVRNKRDGRIGIVLHQWKSGSVAVLESINPRVINTHDSWNTLEIVTDEVEQTQTKCETIPVSLVEEKILNPMKEEHDKAIKGFMKRDIPQCIEDGGIAQELGYFIGKIEELLEKR